MLLLVLLAAACSAAARQLPASSACQSRPTSSILGLPYLLTGSVCPVHDPALAQDTDGSLHIFSTDLGTNSSSGCFLPHRCSQDGLHWALCGCVFAALPPWLLALLPSLPGLWAPDVSYDHTQQLWLLYYAASSFGSQDSVIGLAASPSLSQPQWQDRGPVLASSSASPFNAIDPSRSPLSELAFGSFWAGLYAVPLASDGRAAAGAAAATHLAQRPPPDALEATSLILLSQASSATPTAWLLASWDFCCRGVHSTYNVRAGTALNYSQGSAFLDRDGVGLLQGGGTLLLGGGHGWAAAGGQSPLRTATPGLPPAAAPLPLALHAYDSVAGDPWLQLVSLDFASASGWVAAVPYAAAPGQQERGATAARV
jgi:arabinan endo-1,5-alpha-L-arabinosidase